MDKIEEEIAELRHNELICGILGSMLSFGCLIGGFVITMYKVIRYEWRGLTLYEITEYPLKNFGIAFIIFGVVTGLLLLVAAMYYSWKRKKLLRSIGVEQSWWK